MPSVNISSCLSSRNNKEDNWQTPWMPIKQMQANMYFCKGQQRLCSSLLTMARFKFR